MPLNIFMWIMISGLLFSILALLEGWLTVARFVAGPIVIIGLIGVVRYWPGSVKGSQPRNPER